jgi:hypothetical protein
MKRTLGLLVVLGLAATPALAQKVTIDYAHDFDFENVKTFKYVDTKDSDTGSELMRTRIVDAIKRELREGGLEEVSENPDLYVTSHGVARENTVYNTTGYGYGGYGRGWYGWGGGMASTTTTATTYTEGTLVIDAYEPSEKKMVWRGTGTVTVKSKPEKQMKQVDKILAKLGKRWDKILAGQGK